MFPQISGFGLNASTPQKAAVANGHERRPETPPCLTIAALKTERYLGPANDRLAAQESDYAGFKRRRTRMCDNGCCDDDVAAIVERNRKRRALRALGSVCAAAPLHPRNLDGATGS